MEFSTEELDFFNNIFTETSTDCMVSDAKHQLSVQTDVPQSLRQILVGSKLTLLAEISHYQLWFPVSLTMSKAGDFSPKLGTPEIIDVNGSERSWRVNTPKNVAIIDVFHDQKIEVLSLSATGLTFKIPNSAEHTIDLQHSSLEMSLAGEEPLKLELDLVRHDNNVVAAKFKDLQEGRESLRKFLFNSHKIKYSNLYQDIIL
ncbi:MAG: hypothetical protein HRT50_13875 [Colwellia sp.]|uniref:hypothetical protein n=1 Tax=Colwellia sp. TaxID=56799 RepID=UPI001D99F3D4|nr:hypothetical protein [Colwellia sp.]NQY50162.1 hypothetical protein [Colwellia sp.]